MSIEKQLPVYESHKKVQAAKIKSIRIKRDGSAFIDTEDDVPVTIVTKPGYKKRYEGTLDDLGYYVRYEDGFESWSPTKAFEEGYSIYEPEEEEEEEEELPDDQEQDSEA